MEQNVDSKNSDSHLIEDETGVQIEDAMMRIEEVFGYTRDEMLKFFFLLKDAADVPGATVNFENVVRTVNHIDEPDYIRSFYFLDVYICLGGESAGVFRAHRYSYDDMNVVGGALGVSYSGKELDVEPV